MSKGKIITINPNNGKYFEDQEPIIEPTLLYQGIYDYIPVYPRYAMSCSMFNYTSMQPEIYFKSLLPVKGYYVEVHAKYIIDVRIEDCYTIAINQFKVQCEEWKKTINPKNYVRKKNKLRRDIKS